MTAQHELALQAFRTFGDAIWLFTEGAISLILIHGDRGYFVAAADAATTLIKHHLKS